MTASRREKGNKYTGHTHVGPPEPRQQRIKTLNQIDSSLPCLTGHEKSAPPSHAIPTPPTPSRFPVCSQDQNHTAADTHATKCPQKKKEDGFFTLPLYSYYSRGGIKIKKTKYPNEISRREKRPQRKRQGRERPGVRKQQTRPPSVLNPSCTLTRPGLRNHK